jgi:hypothetical protein
MQRGDSTIIFGHVAVLKAAKNWGLTTTARRHDGTTVQNDSFVFVDMLCYP